MYPDDPFGAQRRGDAQREAVYESGFWKNDVSPRVGELLDRSRIQVQRIVPNPKSVAR